MHAIDAIASPVPAQAKWAFTTRRIDRADIAGLSSDLRSAVPGDLVLAQITRLGHHRRIQLASGRASENHIGDYVVLALGDRYAPDQFEGSAELDPSGCDLIAGGGIIGSVINAHALVRPPTRLVPHGLLTDAEGDVLNVAAYALPEMSIPGHVTVIGVFGTSMNSGKTTTAASLAHGLAKAGFRVAGVKATGTGAFGDYNAFLDAGIEVLDFTDAGMATTYKMPLERIATGFQTLVGTSAAKGAEVVVVEFADGVFQREARQILTSSSIRDRLDAFVFAAGDAAGAIGGVGTARGLGIEPMLVSGLISLSPLGSAEARASLDLPVLTREQLHDGDFVAEMVSPYLRRAARLPTAA